MWALRTKAVLDRTRLALQDKAEHYQNLLQPTAEYLGTLLGVENWAVSTSLAYSSSSSYILNISKFLILPQLTNITNVSLVVYYLEFSVDFELVFLTFWKSLVNNLQMEIFTEEMIRSGSAASLSLLLNRLDPVIRKEANMGR